MRKLIMACSALIFVASCTDSPTKDTTDKATLEKFSQITGIHAVSVDTALYYYSPEYRFIGGEQVITVDNITSQDEKMRAKFRDDMSQREPFELFTVTDSKDTVYVRYCRGYDEFGSEARILKAVAWDDLFIPADRFEAVLAELGE